MNYEKETVGTIILMILCTCGGLLIGFNAGHLSNGLNATLFVVGIVLISSSTTIVGFLQTILKRKNK